MDVIIYNRLVIELKKQLLPSRCQENNKLSKHLNELYHNVTDGSSPVDSSSKSAETIADTSCHYLTDCVGEAHSLTDIHTGIFCKDEEAHMNSDHEETKDQKREWGEGGEHWA